MYQSAPVNTAGNWSERGKKTDTQAHVISQNISCFQRQINPGSFPGTYNPDSSTSPDPNHTITSYTITRRVDESLENGTKVKEKQMKIPHNCSQVLVVKHGEEKTVGAIEGDKSELANFTGLYSEEESARSFQEALIQWRQERIDGKRKLVTTDVPWRPALVSATSTQTDLPPDRESEGQNREGAEQKLTVKLEFTENSLTYMDRLLLKKHRRTPVESPPSLAFGMDIKSLPTTDTEEDMVSSLTAEEEDFQQYWSSLFNVPVSKDRNEPQVSTSGLCLNIEVLDEICRDIKKVSFSEQELDNNIMVSKADHSSPCPNHPPRPSITSVQQKTGRKPHCPQDQNSKINDSANASTSDCGTSACITAGTSKKSAKPPTSHASRSIRSPTINKLEDNCGSPRFFPSLPDSQFIIHKSSQPSDLFTTDVSILDFATSVIPEENLSPSSSLSFSLRSTFSVSPSDSTQCVLLPKVCHSTPQQSDTKKPQSSQLFAETISSVNPYETPRSNLISPHQFQLPSSEPDCLLLDNQLTHSLSPGTVKPQPTSKALESIISIANPVPDNGPPYFCHKSVLKYEDAGGHKSTPSCKEAHCTSPNSVPNLTDNVVETEEEKYLEESEDEMSSDSLNLTLPEDDSCREEAQVMQNQTAGFGSEQFCDLDGFSPLGLDTDTGCPGSPVHSRSDGLHTCQFSVRDSDPTVRCSHSSLGRRSEEYLVCNVMKDSHAESMGIQIHSTKIE
ncbi:hypothetical protein CHARACLAT_005931 [Characodon lateralis]|uniref:Uncharacterized protein n=1 Tax=Characodon lateralis TaxID=208331 RepID=A0ABU7D4H5_9TELE|nr:hypothetical protein [Characodon lateralis]